MPRTKKLKPEEIIELTKRYIQESLTKEPLSLKGLYRWCIRNNLGCIHHYFENTKAAYGEYAKTCIEAKQLIASGFIGRFERQKLSP